MTNRLKGLALSDTGFLFDPTTGHTYTLNRTGCEVLKWMRQGVSEALLVSRIAETFEVSLDEADRDCAAFVKQLRDYRLLEEKDGGKREAGSGKVPPPGSRPLGSVPLVPPS